MLNVNDERDREREIHKKNKRSTKGRQALKIQMSEFPPETFDWLWLPHGHQILF